ncbi:hypothetical protein LNQ52_21185 [Klebsiella pneumoniae subsp. pneumoniae]|nr:hypothetical protein [Klebsiella pneumoniae subsp. pneumoniae]
MRFSLIFTNRQRGAKKVASHFAQLVLLPIVMHKTMHSLTGKDSVVEISYGRALWRNFLGQSPDWYLAGINHFLNRKSAGVRRGAVCRRLAAGG